MKAPDRSEAFLMKKQTCKGLTFSLFFFKFLTKNQA